jgi:hypothetical protein
MVHRHSVVGWAGRGEGESLGTLICHRSLCCSGPISALAAVTGFSARFALLVTAIGFPSLLTYDPERHW